MKKFISLFLLFFASIAAAGEVKESDLAGSWYPTSKMALQGLVQGYLDQATPPKVNGQVIAIISPHAGYQFSGPVAAYGYKLVKDQNIRTVIILGFSHRKFFDGVSIYNKGIWRTPLGDAEIDEALASQIISGNPRIRFEPALFQEENSVEMQIPFIQIAFKDAKIVPIAFGNQDYKDAQILAGALSSAVKNRNDILIVTSTDMSHYHPYAEANLMDRYAITILDKLDAKHFYDEVSSGNCELCGLMPVAATLLIAKNLGFDRIETLKYANSGDTAGDKTKVVGYLSAAIYKEGARLKAQGAREEEKKEEMSMLNDAQKRRLLEIAREAITSYVRGGKRKEFSEKDPVLNEPMGTFVTLHENGELRGCIGNMVGHGPLYETVADMAVESATGDPRFPPLSPDEIGRIDIEISVLSPMKKVSSHEEVRIPGHGVMVRRGLNSGVYLPQVATETGWSKEEFLTSLCAHKAGLPPDAWRDPKTDIYVFSAEVFGEKER